MEEETTKSTVRFHSYHGDNAELSEDNTVAFRKLSYKDALIFSEKSLIRGEIFLVETENDPYNDMSIGLTQFDPHVAASMGFSELNRPGRTWIYTVQNPRDLYSCHDSEDGLYSDDGICDNCNGYHGGILAMSLQSICRDVILQHVEDTEVPSLPLPKALREYLLYQSRYKDG